MRETSCPAHAGTSVPQHVYEGISDFAGKATVKMPPVASMSGELMEHIDLMVWLMNLEDI